MRITAAACFYKKNMINTQNKNTKYKIQNTKSTEGKHLHGNKKL